ncbi:MAG: DUF167 domain-containing protein [Patescibacteria group bacterium]|nr:DUF167 domain-containing protein [Patescibacteria group bacterium]
MKIFVKAKPNAKENKIIPPPLRLFESGPAPHEATQDTYTVSVKERPIGGRANEAITKLLAEHFKVSCFQVRLISGATSKRKVFEIKN